MQQELTCPHCGKVCKNKQGLSQHIHICRNNPDYELFQQQHPEKQGGCCEYCGKHYDTHNQLIQHELRCPHNDDRIENKQDGTNHFAKYYETHDVWNKGQTKENNAKILHSSNVLKNKFMSGELIPAQLGRHRTLEEKKHLREVAIQNNYENHFGRHKTYTYNDCNFLSSYEVEVAKSLDKNNIKWVQPNKLPYIDLEGKKHTYTADFYLPDYDVYLDPKNDYLIENVNPVLGYKDMDKISWVMQQNNVQVLILNKEQLSWDAIKSSIFNT